MSIQKKRIPAQAQKLRPDDTAITLSVPEAGKRFFGLSRNGSYAAAKRGDIPTVRIGKLRRVPVAVLHRKIEALAR